MIGKTISHYKILEKLGEGGMGVVYKAEDTQLKRPVALKFLSPELTRDPEAKKRFVHEAQAASALDHPNICTIHEIDETEDGQLFMVMAYYEGETLKQKIAQGRLSVDAMVEMVRHIAQGLIAAHEKGIIHRDIKPANVMIIPEGMAKILDFGLARLAGQGGMTRTGMTAGTVAYMSPEQVGGEKVDPRTDIWSLGVVLYEMLAGRLPFEGEYEAAVMYAIVNDEPQSVTSTRQETPQNLEQIVRNALEKDPENRYQSMEEILAELKKTEPVSVGEPEPEKSIVVFPFVNMSPDPEQEYFSDGLTEEIITDLSHIHELRVISRTSAMMLKGTKKDMKTIGGELNVQYVLEGSVRKAGNNLRITAQLIDAINDTHLWAEKYSGTLDDVFDIQEKVSRSIVDALKLKLTPEENQEITNRPIENLQAYECYLKARYEYWRLTEDALERSLQLLQNGFEIVGENELLYAAKGTIYWQYVNAMLKPAKNFGHYLKEADECAKKVFTLNPDSSVGHVLKGEICQNSGNPKEAIRHFKRAVEIDSNNPEALMWLGYMYAASGKETVGRGFLEKVAELDPLTLFRGVPGWVGIFEGNFSAAVEDFYKMYQVDSENPVIRWWYAWPLAMDNRIRDALTILDSIEINVSQMNPWENLCLFRKYTLRGQKEDALQSVTSELMEAFKWDDIWSLLMAECYSILHEPEQALVWLENTIRNGIINYPFLNEYDPFLENIRGEERFKKLMERVKVEWESFEV